MPLIKLIVDGENMKPGPSVSQQLGPMGVNLGKLIEEVNKSTKGFKGMKVPVEINVNPKTKEFAISVSSPPVSELLKKELGVEKGSGSTGSVKIGNLAIEQIISVAKTKTPGMLAKTLKSAVKLVVGSCVSSGILIESKSPKEIIEEIDSGKYDKEISHEKTEVPAEKRKALDSFFKEITSKQEAQAKAEAAAKEAAEAAKEAAKAEVKPGEKPAEKSAEKKPAEKEEKQKKK